MVLAMHRMGGTRQAAEVVAAIQNGTVLWLFQSVGRLEWSFWPEGQGSAEPFRDGTLWFLSARSWAQL